MARKKIAKASGERAGRSGIGKGEDTGRGNILGILIISIAVLLLAALASYRHSDLPFNSNPPNAEVQNLIGTAGAWVGFICFLVFGAIAFLLPLILLGTGLAHYFPIFRRLFGTWRVCLISLSVVFACMGMLDLLGNLLGYPFSMSPYGAGGFIGAKLNDWFFVRFFHEIGAAIIYLTVYATALVAFTNLDVGAFLQELWERCQDRLERFDIDASLEERQLKRQARKLAKEERLLKAGLAPADTLIESYPEPTVRDHSISASSPVRLLPGSSPGGDHTPLADIEAETTEIPIKEPAPRKNPAELPASTEAAPVALGETIPAEEVAATTATDILGHPADTGTADVANKDNPAAEVPEPVITLSSPQKPPPAFKKKKSLTVATPPVIGDYSLPSIEALDCPAPNIISTDSRDSLMANAKLMQNTLAQFGIKVALGDITKGPTFTRYELHPAPGIKLERINSLNNNITAALKAERINILVPVPGKGSVGIEIPNTVKTKVIIRDLLESEEWSKTKARLPLVLGKDVYGTPMVVDLTDMPHLLIAGSTGSGKSVCINAIIASLLYRYSPEDLRFVMIDPKVVELQAYNALPHLVVPVVTDPKKVVLALRWVINEMEKRYQIFAKVGVRNIQSFNKRPIQPPPEKPPPPETTEDEEGFAVEIDEEIAVPREDDDILIPEKLSYIVVIIDELADLMLVAPADVEMAIARITQMARAAGIHCIVATQRPSVDVITGVIKANIPARIAFQVASKTDSRTILDSMGADKLLGKGDMLYLPPGSAKLIRAQGVLITDEEILNIVNHIAQQATPSYETEIHQQLSKPASAPGNGDSDEDEELIQKCIDVIRSEQKASVSLLQRRLRIGYTRAARIMDELENCGIVGPAKGAEPREILPE